MEQTIYPLLIFFQIVQRSPWRHYSSSGSGSTVPESIAGVSPVVLSVVVSAITAFRSIDPDIMDLARTPVPDACAPSGRSRYRTRVDAVHGIKVAAALSATAAVVAEFVASDRGLGNMLLEANGNLNTTMAFGAIFVLTALGFALYAAVELVERLVIPWHVSQRSEVDTPHPV
jgi:NitT/TauT family transport system permease protein